MIKHSSSRKAIAKWTLFIHFTRQKRKTYRQISRTSNRKLAHTFKNTSSTIKVVRYHTKILKVHLWNVQSFKKISFSHWIMLQILMVMMSTFHRKKWSSRSTSVKTEFIYGLSNHSLSTHLSEKTSQRYKIIRRSFYNR